MEPNYRPIRTGGPAFSIFAICFLVAAVLTLGIWMYWKRGQAAATPAPATAGAPNTNNNPIARASRTLGAVEAANREGENTADTIQNSPRPAATTRTETPTRAIAAPAAASGPKLQGIFFSANNASAIINGKSVKAGDEIDGLKILEIKKQSVRVQKGSEVRELTMK